jgi:hypothetical protein
MKGWGITCQRGLSEHEEKVMCDYFASRAVREL